MISFGWFWWVGGKFGFFVCFIHRELIPAYLDPAKAQYFELSPHWVLKLEDGVFSLHGNTYPSLWLV